MLARSAALLSVLWTLAPAPGQAHRYSGLLGLDLGFQSAVFSGSGRAVSQVNAMTPVNHRLILTGAGLSGGGTVLPVFSAGAISGVGVEIYGLNWLSASGAPLAGAGTVLGRFDFHTPDNTFAVPLNFGAKQKVAGSTVVVFKNSFVTLTGNRTHHSYQSIHVPPRYTYDKGLGRGGYFASAKPTGRYVKVEFAPWSALGGSDARTPFGQGFITLVSPMRVTTHLSPTETYAGAAYLVIEVVPEPTTALLLGIGVAGLAALGRARARRG
jgi:PEP-CTERM motif